MDHNNRYTEAFALIRQGYQFQKKGNIRQAIRHYRASIKIVPTAEAHTYLGWAFSLQGRYDKAIQECFRAMELDDEFGNPYNDLGYYLTMLRQYDEALYWLKKAIDAPRFDDRYWAYYNLGRVYELTGQWKQAEEQYLNSVRLNTKFRMGKDALMMIQGLKN
jgi:tetratricopeptide (TPR) repeat protein